jgi:hypothetical protein
MSAMRLTITTLADDVYQLEVSDELEVENFKGKSMIRGTPNG